jgi:hypothetical protein
MKDKVGMGTTKLAAERPHTQPPPPTNRPGFLVRPSGDGLCQRATAGMKPAAARGSLAPGGFPWQPPGLMADRHPSHPALWPQADLIIPHRRENARY